MSSDSESDVKRPNGIAAEDGVGTPIEPSTPQETAAPELSQVTLPSTEVPGSPVDETDHRSRAEGNEDRIAITVIPSSLTPPPSTQIAPPPNGQLNGNIRRDTARHLSHSQESNFVSPPATINSSVRGRDVSSDYTPPSATQIREGSAEELRTMLQTCIAEHQKLKMETAHHRLQYNLLSLQASEDSNRSEVELEMLRKEIEALRTAEHSRQAKQELKTFSEGIQNKYLDLKTDYEDAIEEVDVLSRRLKHAKQIIQQKDDEVMSLMDERSQLLNRIRENREHMNKLRSPGGIFYGTTTPRETASPAHNRQAARGLPENESGHRWNSLLEVISQDNNSEPSTPITPQRPGGRQKAKHQRNAQSMSSLPTTPVGRPHGRHASLLPSADLVPQTEPPQRYPHGYDHNMKGRTRRGSRESTISASDNDDLARQAAGSFTSNEPSSQRRRGDDDSDVFDSQASRAATEMLRRIPHNSFGSSAGSPDTMGVQSGPMRSRLLSNIRDDPDKRKFSGQHAAVDSSRGGEQGSPQKKTRVGSGSVEHRRLGLGIRYDD